MSGLTVTWWGHAFATVDLGGVRVATDPLLSDRLVHLRRYARTPTARATDADVVLVSHLHLDHLHLPSLGRFGLEVPILVPKGGESLLRRLRPEPVRPVEPGDVVEVRGARITVLPATHDGRRGPQSKAVGPPLGFRVDAGGRSFWFPGDTEVRPDMAAVGHVDLALVPIGGWGPSLGDGHMDPVDGAEAVARVGADVAVPVHWGTFWPLGFRVLMQARHEHLFVTPGDRFLAAMATRAPQTRAVLMAPGETLAL